MPTYVYQVIKNEKIVEEFDLKQDAINYAIENDCDLIVKYSNFDFEPLGVVWESSK